MKTAVWLYLFLFVAFFDLHAQYPILTPFAVSLGAAPSFIGLMMGLYSITHLPGNLIAGYGVDRFGSKPFIVFSLLTAGGILLLQAAVETPLQLLVLRSVSGFVLAFLSPACSALLARLASSAVQQGKLMAGNGFVHTLASVISPAAGALLVARIGFETAFYMLGWVLIGTAVCALLFIRDVKADAPEAGAHDPAEAGGGRRPAPALAHGAGHGAAHGRAGAEANGRSGDTASGSEAPFPWIVYLLPVAMACAQGILSFELPLMSTTREGMLTTGLLFSVVSLGALITLSMLFLHRYSAYMRTLLGSLFLAVAYFAIAAGSPIPLAGMLLLLGMAKGVIFPALSTLLIELSGSSRYGRTFSILSIAFSIGSFLGPLLAGQLRDHLSPYFIAFLGLMIAVTLLPFHRVRGAAPTQTRLN